MGGFCISRKGGIGGGGWSHPQGDMHMVAARLGFKGNGWYWVSRLELGEQVGSGYGFNFGVSAWTEIEIWCVRDV